jgi:two-component system chemotaxis sensor kinase CheA
MPPLDTVELARRLLTVFRQEQAEHAAAVRDLLSEPRNALPPAARDEVFRRFHSLKGAARAVDLPEVEALAHRAETLLGRLRAGESGAPPAEAVASALQRTLDAIDALVAAGSPDASRAEREQATAEAAVAAAAIDALVFGSEASAVAAMEPAADPVPEDGATAPDAEAALSAATAAEAEPADVPAAPAAAPTAVAADDVVRVSVQRLDGMMNDARQIRLDAVGWEAASDDLAALERRLERLSGLLSATPDAAAAEQARGIVESARMEMRTLRGRERERAWRLERLAERVQETISATRLVQAEYVTAGFERMVAELGRENGKEVSLQVHGEEIALDRQVAQALRDPLLHLLRNSIRHGIEPPEEREARGKARAGAIQVRFTVRGTILEVSVQDDGRGLDVDAVRRAAGIGRPVTPEEAAQLIFRTGLSTTASADRLSGRGMGLSVVARAAARLGGEVHAEPVTAPRGGSGSGGLRFRLLLPLSVAASRLLFVEASGQQFGLPTFAVEGLYRLDADRIERIEGAAFLRVPDRSAPLPAADLGALLGLPPAPVAAAATALQPRVSVAPFVAIRLEGRTWALRVDRLHDEGEALIRPLGPYLTGVPLFSGSVLCRDGSVALAILAGELATLVRSRSGGSALPEAAGAQARRVHTILVVDDSVTTRELERSILEAHGYRVRVAVDGMDALSQLHESLDTPADAPEIVVSDVEMPRMTGFDLLAAVREDAHLKRLPLILVTSREAVEDRERGLALGADAYIVKQKFDQNELLETIEQLLV